MRTILNSYPALLAARAYKYFDTVPPNIAMADFSFYIVANYAYMLGWIMHFTWIMVFWYLGVYAFMAIQLVSITVFAIAIVINRRGQHLAAMVIGMAEVMLHQLAAVYFLGWDTGFQYLLPVVALFPFLMNNGSLSVKLLLLLCNLLSFLYIEIYLRRHAPVFNLSHVATSFFNYSNIVFAFNVIANYGLALTAAYQRSLSVLMEKEHELTAAEKAKDQAEMLRQLEVKERDNEIYRLKNVELKKSHDEIEGEKRRSEALLLNILPGETAVELLRQGFAQSRNYEMATVMFTDFSGFTRVAERTDAEELVKIIDRYFRAFDEITQRHKVEKIKTIGDAYMCAGGLPATNKTHPVDVVNAAIDILRYTESNQSGHVFEVRVGLHTGPLVAGVVGQHKFQYDIWGDTVNVAARMEQHSEPGRINISGATFELVKGHFACSYRGKIKAKNKEEMDMYFVDAKR